VDGSAERSLALKGPACARLERSRELQARPILKRFSRGCALRFAFLSEFASRPRVSFALSSHGRAGPPAAALGDVMLHGRLSLCCPHLCGAGRRRDRLYLAQPFALARTQRVCGPAVGANQSRRHALGILPGRRRGDETLSSIKARRASRGWSTPKRRIFRRSLIVALLTATRRSSSFSDSVRSRPWAALSHRSFIPTATRRYSAALPVWRPAARAFAMTSMCARLMAGAGCLGGLRGAR